MSTNKTNVFIVGATGRTGESVARAVLKCPDTFNLTALIRPTSLSNPIVLSLQDSGAHIIQGDISSSTIDQLTSHLQNTDVLISTVMPGTVDQTNLWKAAQKVGTIKRVVPSDFGTVCGEGEMMFQDMKLKVHETLASLSLPYTSISVGWWLELSFPPPHSTLPPPLHARTDQFILPGTTPCAVTALTNIGTWVTKIIQDDRTINKKVLVYDHITTMKECWEVASKVLGDEDFSDYPRITSTEIDQSLATAQSTGDLIPLVWYQYIRSIYINGDNTPTNAVENLGYLDGRQLYPDYQPASLEELAKEYVYKDGGKSWPPFRMHATEEK